METKHEDSWVANRLAAIEPQWSPNFARGRELLYARLLRRHYSWTWMAAAATTAVVCVAVLLPTGNRALAQELWYRFVLNRVDVVRLDLSKMPLQMQITTNGLEQSVQNVDEAERKAGFRPYLPSLGVQYANPGISITGPISVEQTIHVRDIEASLRNVGAGDVHVPPEWEGVQLHTEIGPMVEVSYPDGVHIQQAQPIELSVPSGFDLEHFSEIAFRSIGVSSWEARAIGRRFVAHPAWLLDIPADAAVNVREVALRAGPALLIEEFDEKGAVKRAMVVRSTSERVYSVSSGSPDLSLKIADALP
ncbi:MAG: hypothetical protein WAM69_01665 [Candidatus Sulfotelmatobacter sp.]